MKRLWYVGICLLILSQTAIADDNCPAEDFLKGRLEAVFAVLQNEELAQQAKSEEIVEIVSPMFDFALMAKLTLGKKYWPGLTEENKEKFTDLFIKKLRASYLSKLTLYSDEKIIYEPPVQDKNKVRISTYLISKDKKISMLYKFYNSMNSWKIYDVEIQGVSIIRSYRSQFYEILQNGTIDELLLKLEESVDK
ncbi:MAG: ABC transporter substrate-binding protein [Desulfobacterales bacterium]